MAFAGSVVWEVRTTGSDANGGGFDPTSGVPGTDYSQQDAAQIAYTDLVIGGTTTQCTSAANPFTAAHVGNIINVTGGVNFTVQRVQITSVAGGVATCDKSLGTAAASGGTGNLGGGLLTIAKVLTLVVNNNTVYIKGGTYTITSGLVLPNSTELLIIGYTSTRTDLGRPTITSATNSVALFAVGSGPYFFQNFHLTHTAATRGDAFQSGGSFNSFGGLILQNCIIDGCLNGVNGTTTNSNIFDLVVFNCEIKNCTNQGINNGFAPTFIIDSFIHNCTSDGININNGRTNAPSYIVLIRVISYANGGKGYVDTANMPSYCRRIFINCVFHTNTSDGVNFSTGSTGPSITMLNCLLISNGGFGVKIVAPAYDPHSTWADFNGYYNNTSGPRSAWITGAHDVTLTSDPCNSPSGGDFSLGSGAGGTAAKAAGFPGALVAGGTGFLDLGSLQSQGSGGGGGGTVINNYFPVQNVTRIVGRDEDYT